MDEKCPVTLNQIAQATFESFHDGDWDGFAGCAGKDPQIAVIGDYVVILDMAEETTMIQVHTDDHSWGWEISTQPEQLF